MKKRFWLYAFVLMVLILAVFLVHSPAQHSANSEPAAQGVDSASTAMENVTNLTAHNVEAISQPAVTSQPNPLSAAKPIEPVSQQKAQAWIDENNAEINFYGRVIDQDETPLPGVKIQVKVRQWYLPVPPTDNVEGKMIPIEKETKTDGQFEITGVQGDGFDVEFIQKEGYELSHKAPHHYGISNGSVNYPVIIKMWKTDEKAKLITGGKFWGIIPDGRVYTIDLLQGTKTESSNAIGDLRITVTRPSEVSRKDRYGWSFHITPVDGGILATEDDFMYQAPEIGYTPEYHFHLEATDTNWTYRVKKDFYLKTRDHYARINVEVFARYQNEGVFSIGYAVNPTGSRNLQP